MLKCRRFNLITSVLLRRIFVLQFKLESLSKLFINYFHLAQVFFLIFLQKMRQLILKLNTLKLRMYKFLIACGRITNLNLL